MSITLSFVEQDIVDGVKANHPLLADEIERIGVEVIKKGGLVRIEDANVASWQQIRNADTFCRWMAEFRKRHGVMGLAEAVAFDPNEKSKKVRDIPDRPR